MQGSESTFLNILEPDNRRQRELILHEKTIYFRVIGSKLALSRRARHAYPATEAISDAIAEKRRFLVPKCKRALGPWEGRAAMG
jgi:undecaprenyl pyrophosphate synthase